MPVLYILGLAGLIYAFDDLVETFKGYDDHSAQNFDLNQAIISTILAGGVVYIAGKKMGVI